MKRFWVPKFVSLGLLSVSLLASFAGLAYPLYVIRPFRRQGARELAAALAVIQVRPFAEVACTVCALAALMLFWVAEARRSRRVWAAVGAGLTCIFAGLSSVNVYELMFHPAGRPVLTDSAKAKIDADDMVIAVRLNGVAHAYPIRIIGYHHIINDVVGREPVVATY